MRYYIYESFTDGGGEHKLTRVQIRNLFPTDELYDMVESGTELIKESLRYWAE